MKNLSTEHFRFSRPAQSVLKARSLIAAAPIAIGLAVTAGGQAHAQVSDIVVTAERREEKLQDTKISITAVDSKAIEELGITEYTGIANIAPNLSMQDIPTSFGGTIGIRGFRNGETISTFEPKVALYLDGVLIAKNAGSAFSVLDLERIEVLRGPQGTLYGRNTVGGAVNLITKKPTSDFEVKLTATIGNFGQHDFKGTINVPLMGSSGDSRLNLRATVGNMDHKGYYRNLYPAGPNRRFANSDRTVAHVQLQWEPSADVSFLYAFDKTWVDEVNPAPVLTRYNMVTKPNLAPYVLSASDQKKYRYIDYGMYVKGRVEGHSLTAEWRPSDTLTLVSITALRKLTYDSAQDADGTPVWVINTEAGDTTETFTQELRAVGDFADSRFEYVAGAFYMDEKIKEAYSHNYLPNAGGLFSNVDGTARNKIWAIYGQATYHITDQLDFTGGLRYTHEKRTMTRTDSTLFDALPQLNSINVLPDAGPKNFSDVSGTASLSYKWTEDVMTYIKFSKGYASGGFNLRSPSPATFTTGYRAEHVYTYEFGWKTTWFDDKLLINGALFYNDYKDLQVTVLDPATTRNNLVNAATAKIKGVELEVQIRPTKNLQFGGGWGYLDTKYNKYVDPVTGADLAKINKFAQAPKHTVNVYGRYVVPDIASDGDLVFRVDYSWRSKYSILSAPGNETFGYGLLNGRIALERVRLSGDCNLTLAFWAKNITNKLYYQSGYNLVSSLGFEGRFTGAPRTFGGDLVIEF